jgi:hypothetical protein
MFQRGGKGEARNCGFGKDQEMLEAEEVRGRLRKRGEVGATAGKEDGR